MTIPVQEGASYRVAGFRLSGNTLLDEKELIQHVHLAAGEPADGSRLRQDLAEISALYRRRGYLRARAESEPLLDDAAHSVTYALRIREGDLYRMGKLEIVGLDPELTATLMKHCDLKPGDPFNGEYWGQFVSTYGSRPSGGLRGWTISRQQRINDDAKTVDVTILFVRRSER